MRKGLLLLVGLCLMGHLLRAQGQGLPFFAQRFTNGLEENPGMAGMDGGRVAFTHQRRWNGLQQPVLGNFLSAQGAFGARQQFGAGVSMFQERREIFKEAGASAALAYRVALGGQARLSFGLSGDFRQLQLDWSNIRVRESNDPLILNFRGYQALDVSFGAALEAGPLLLGVGATQLSRQLRPIEEESSATVEAYFPPVFSALAALRFPIGEQGSQWEARMQLRDISAIDLTLLDMGMFYTYRSMVFAGVSWRNNRSFGWGAGLTIKDWTVQYAQYSFAQDPAKGFGASSEITLAYSFGGGNIFYERNANRSPNRQAVGRPNNSRVVRDGKKLYWIKKRRP